MKNSRTIL